MNHEMSLIAIIIVSFIAGYLSSMNIWTVSPDHVRSHWNDNYMILLMTGWTLLFSFILWSDSLNTILSIVFIIVIVYAIRVQAFVNDMHYLNGMIPHHSMAILMSEKILERTKNPRVRSLAQHIIESQYEEIDLMNDILNEKKVNFIIMNAKNPIEYKKTIYKCIQSKISMCGIFGLVSWWGKTTDNIRRNRELLESAQMLNGFRHYLECMSPPEKRIMHDYFKLHDIRDIYQFIESNEMYKNGYSTHILNKFLERISYRLSDMRLISYYIRVIDPKRD